MTTYKKPKRDPGRVISVRLTKAQWETLCRVNSRAKAPLTISEMIRRAVQEYCRWQDSLEGVNHGKEA